jgi:hypothetical protein
MRKIALALLIICGLVFSFAFNVSAHAVQTAKTTQVIHPSLRPLKEHPYATGGGCGGLRVSAYGDISGKACISYTSPNVRPDGYVSFKPLTNHNGAYDCSLDLVLYYTDPNSGNLLYVTDQFYNCTYDAIHGLINVHFGPIYYNIGLGYGTYCSRIEDIVVQYNDGFHTDLTTYYSPGVNTP